MATPTSTVAEYCLAAAKSKLLTEAEVRQAHQGWLADTRGNNQDVDSFRKYLIKKNLLTEYQAALLQRGRAEGFFISEYKILDRIGSGQNAGVYKAVHNKSGQIVALKVLPSSKAKDVHTLNRFQREGRLLTALDHPNVVRAYQISQTGNVHFIVMEHLEGETLDHVIERRKKLPPEEAVRVIYQAMQGLEHLHEKRMVHRDLKPSNLMIAPGRSGKVDTTLDSTVKVLDIGLGRELFDENSPATQDLQLTGEGALLGTPDYLAPEQARDARAADIRADIYSLGCVLYHLVAGQPPFPEKNVMSQMVRHATEKPISVANFTAGVPAGLDVVISRFLEKAPADRPQTPTEALELLKPFLPSKAKQAEKAPVLPAYKEWLESESQMEMPVMAPPTSAPVPVPASPKSSAPVPAPTKPSKPKSQPAIKPVTVQPSASVPAPQPPVEINVELVDLTKLQQSLSQARLDDDEEEDEPRGPLDFNRRDFFMLGSGALGILFAIGLGYGLSRVLRPRETSPSTESGEKQEK